MSNVKTALMLFRLREQLADGTAVQIRERAGLSRPEGAAAADIDPSTLWRWECRARTARGAGALRYARLLQALEAQLVDAPPGAPPDRAQVAGARRNDVGEKAGPVSHALVAEAS
jgi:transcriptional regulator with XRE-family HTH domain